VPILFLYAVEVAVGAVEIVRAADEDEEPEEVLMGGAVTGNVRRLVPSSAGWRVNTRLLVFDSI